jgi:hypothetical protein
MRDKLVSANQLRLTAAIYKEGLMAKKEFQVTFETEKETTGTVRYSEVGDKDSHKIGKLYLKKAAAKSLGNPKTIGVTVSAG